MAERVVLRMGDPRLRQVASPVEHFDTLALHALVEDLWDTMAAYGGIGLAATQIGVDSRVVVFGLPDGRHAPGRPEIPPTVLVNPVIEPLGPEQVEGWEGCLSVPGMRGVVARHERIRYHGRDALGETVDREVSGFHAVVVQHECDHLDGILYPMRMTDMTRFGFVEELDAAFGAEPCSD